VEGLHNFLTIVIPARFRQNTLHRILRYYSDVGCKIIVCDSSPNPFEGIGNYPFAEYYHKPNQQYYEKMLSISHLITTEFVLECAQDDFVIKENLRECIEFLLKHKDYVAVHGQHARFSPGESKRDPFVIEQLHLLRYFKTQKDQFQGSEALSRIGYNLTMGHLTWHAVLRASIYKKIYEIAHDNPLLTSFTLSDYFYAFLIPVYGNIKILPIFYTLRSNEPLPEEYIAVRAQNEKKKFIESILKDDKPSLKIYESLFNVVGVSIFEREGGELKDYFQKIMEIMKDHEMSHSHFDQSDQIKQLIEELGIVEFKENCLTNAISSELYIAPPFTSENYNWDLTHLKGNIPFFEAKNRSLIEYICKLSKEHPG
jgi:glycosyltransferase domain-containing protein